MRTPPPMLKELALIEARIAEKQKVNARLDYAMCWDQIRREEPDLIANYNLAAARVFIGRE
jgi:hypothetical protein